MPQSAFDHLTNQYPVQKTLRFELKPIGKTQELLEKNNIIKKDQLIQEKYELTKPYLDRLHREFTQQSLTHIQLPQLSHYLELYKNFKQDKKTHIKTLQTAEAQLRKIVADHFEITANNWAEKYRHLGIKKSGTELLFEADIFAILKEIYGNETATLIKLESGEKISIFDSWKNFTGYFKKFFETRKNFYTPNGIASAIPTRIIDQNLRTYCDNILIYNHIKHQVNFAQAGENPTQQFEIFNIENYTQYILQNHINAYNNIIGGYTKENGQKIKGLNECINEHRQTTGEKLPYFKTLDKQILGEKDTFTDEINNDEQLKNTLQELVVHSQHRFALFQKLLNQLNSNHPETELQKIYLSKTAFNTISRKWTDATFIFEEALFQTQKHLKRNVTKKDTGYSLTEFIPLSDIKHALETIDTNTFTWKEKYTENKTISAVPTLWQQFLAILTYEYETIYVGNQTQNEIQTYQSLNSTLQNTLTDFTLNQQSRIIIKDFADTTLNLYQLTKYFAVEKKRAWNTELETGEFYNHPETGYKTHIYTDAYEQIVQPYNKIRN